jgi:hypothetical protein
MSFLPKFNNSFYPYLNGNPSEKKKQVYANIFQRADAFRLIFSLLELKNKKSYNIVETGVIRNLGNWNDGQSSFLFQEFLKSGSLVSEGKRFYLVSEGVAYDVEQLANKWNNKIDI